MATKIVTKNSSTAGSAPSASDLVQGELAVNVADKRLYTEDNAGNIVELGTNPLGEITANGGIALGDSDKATFGASDDLQIYHDGSASYVTDTGTGDLILQGTNIQLRSASTKRVLQGLEAGATKIFYDNAEKLATTSTGIDVTGTATMEGLSVLGTTENKLSVGYSAAFSYDIYRSNDGLGALVFDATQSTYNGYIFKAPEGDRLKIAGNGDISFYEDTGTTPKFFWDASAESLGIGTSSPTTALELKSTSTAVGLCITASNSHTSDINMGDTDDVNIQRIRSDHSNNSLQFTTNNEERMRIDSSGNIQQATSVNSDLIHSISNANTGTAAQASLYITNSSANADGFFAGANGSSATTTSGFVQDGAYLGSGTGASGGLSIMTRANADMRFYTNGHTNERAKITSDGDFLVGTTDTLPGIGDTNAGISMSATNGIIISRANDAPINISRNSSDGALTYFRKDGAIVGSISSRSGNAIVIASEGKSGVNFGATSINPWLNGSIANGTVDFGQSGARFKDLHLSGGVVFGTTGGSVSSKTLDDYEEGTFTPVLSDASTGGNLSGYSVRNARYTKVGRMVTIVVTFINITTTGMTASALVYLQGLPFSVVNVSLLNFVGSQYSTGITGAPNVILAGANSTTIYTGIDDVSDIASGTADYYITLTYEAA